MTTVLITIVCTTAVLVASALMVANWYKIVEWGFRHVDHDHTVRSGGRFSTTNPDTLIPFTSRCAKCGLPAPSRMGRKR